MTVAIAAPAQRSGGALYSEKLATALGATIIPIDINLMKIRSTIQRKKIDVIDIQFEYKSFGSHLRTLIGLPLLTFMLSRLARTVITLHGVVTFDSLVGRRGRLLVLVGYVASIRLSALASNEIIVHTDGMKEQLRKYGITNTVVIPHGSTIPSHPMSNFRESKVLFFGFLRPSKGVEKLILAFKIVADAVPNSSLIIAGSTHDPSDAAYLGKLRTLVDQLDLNKRIEFKVGFTSEVEKEALASESSIIVLPYEDTFLEVSGVAHDFAGFGLAMICSRTPRFEEFSDEVNCLKTETNPSEIARSIVRLLELEEERRLLAANLYQFAVSESWPCVARARLKSYSSIVTPVKT